MSNYFSWKVRDAEKFWFRSATSRQPTGSPSSSWRRGTCPRWTSPDCQVGCSFMLGMSLYPWSSLVEGGEGSYLPNCQTTLVIVFDALFLLFCIFTNTTADMSLHLLLLKSSMLYLYFNETFSFEARPIVNLHINTWKQTVSANPQASLCLFLLLQYT